MASASARSQHDAPPAMSESITGAATQGRGQGDGQATPQAEAAVVDVHTYDGWEDDPSAFGPLLSLEYFKERVQTSISSAHRQMLRVMSRAIVCACAEGNDEYPSSEEPYSFDPPFGVHDSLFSRRRWRDLRTDNVPLTPMTWLLHMSAFFVVHLGISIAMQEANHLTLQCQLTAMWWPAGFALFAFLVSNFSCPHCRCHHDALSRVLDCCSVGGEAASVALQLQQCAFSSCHVSRAAHRRTS